MSTPNSEALASVRRKIKALSAKTIENGCTEAEALAAMELVGKLLAQHNLEMSEADVREAGCKEDWLQIKGKNVNNNIGMLLSGIAMFVDAKCYIYYEYKDVPNGQYDVYDQPILERTKFIQYRIFGQEADIEMGSYLLYICTQAMLNDAHKYVKSLNVQQGGARTPRNSFEHGFALRIYRRLKEIKDANKAAQVATTGTSLIVLKSQLVTEEWQKRHNELGLKSRQSSKAQLDGRAYQAGQSAADNVNLQRPIEGKGQADRVSAPNKLLA